MERAREMSGYEFAQVNNFIYQLYEKYGTGLEFDECRSIGYLEYEETRRAIGDACNTEYLWIYAKGKIAEAFKKARRIRNEKIRLESNLSLNQNIGECKEPVYTIIPAKEHGFDRSVCLWLDLRQLEESDYKIISGLYWGADDWEIINYLRMSTDEYFARKSILREMLQKYLEEWMEKQ